MRFKKIAKWTGLVLLIIAITGGILYRIYLYPFVSKMKQTQVIEVDKNLILITGGGGNSGILTSDSLVMVIDTKMDDAAEMLHRKVEEVAGNKPVLVINTHWHPDHVGGNKLYKNASILAGAGYTPELWKKESEAEAMPTRWLKDTLVIPMGTDTAVVFNLAGSVHTPSDMMVYLTQRKMLFAGDVILNHQAPILMGTADGDAYIRVMQNLMQKGGIEVVVPGHGAVGGPEVIASFLTFFTDMKEAAADVSKEGELLAKYKDWNQIPFVMSPGATEGHFKKKR